MRRSRSARVVRISASGFNRKAAEAQAIALDYSLVACDSYLCAADGTKPKLRHDNA